MGAAGSSAGKDCFLLASGAQVGLRYHRLRWIMRFSDCFSECLEGRDRYEGDGITG